MADHDDGLSEETKAIYRAARQALASGGGRTCSDERIAEATGYDINLVRDRLVFLGSDYIDIKPREDGRVDVLGISTEPPQNID
ncbi:hypothetical protein SAMN05660642_04910 [Geodermatophilus siccatus]|uniref:Helix-turn-helix domain-containing protein n=1 Tax=Geodermatophilus siccatus TaxID=1137991 RepID=A0A1H0BPG3_9ACTN|nr:hypothetical protein [Geodermatophilus siccatus]SDN47524.1 hypothetical protein SAMN05660642_04910 [Geodermatophilus siccatus]